MASFKDLFIKSAVNTATVGDVSKILGSLPSVKNTETVTVISTINLVEPIDGIQSIDDLYNKLGMNTSNKIYDILPLIDSLDPSLNIVSKKTSLAKILRAVKLDIDELKLNADECITAIENANISITQTTEQKNDQRRETIQIKLSEIKELEKEIEDEIARQTQQGVLFSEEITKLKTIKGYLE